MLLEKFASSEEVLGALETLRQYQAGSVEWDSRSEYLMSAEIGGLNGLVPLLVSAYSGLSVLDADWMGRAFPELNMVAPSCVAKPGDKPTLLPLALCDERGQKAVFDGLSSNQACEKMARMS